MAGSITVTTADLGGAVTQYMIAWVSDGSGNVSANPLNVKTGRLIQVQHIPDGGGTQPTNLYDVTLLDVNTFDVLVGGGANLVNTGPTYTAPTLTGGYPVYLTAGAFTPVVANAGATKGGKIILYVCSADGTVVGTASDLTKLHTASVSGTITSGHAAQFADAVGTVSDAGLALGSAAALSLVVGFAKHALVAGAVAGNVTVTGIKTTDTLNLVLHVIGAGTTVTDVTDLTSQFTITALNTINNTGGTSSSGNKLLVMWTATS